MPEVTPFLFSIRVSTKEKGGLFIIRSVELGERVLVFDFFVSPHGVINKNTHSLQKALSYTYKPLSYCENPIVVIGFSTESSKGPSV